MGEGQSGLNGGRGSNVFQLKGRVRPVFQFEEEGGGLNIFFKRFKIMTPPYILGNSPCTIIAFQEYIGKNGIKTFYKTEFGILETVNSEIC